MRNIWWLPSANDGRGRFWMEGRDPIANYVVIAEHQDAIQVSNPQALGRDVLAALERDAAGAAVN